MKDLFIYVLQVNLLLSILFLAYHFLLRKLTFYKLNRIYFLIGTGYALLYPFLDLSSVKEMAATTTLSLPIESILVFSENPSSTGITLLDLGGYGAGLISVFLGIRMAIGLSFILRIHRHSVAAQWKNFTYRETAYAISPFSFFNRIYIYRKQHPTKELKAIFNHEKAHVEGLHTLDILFFEIIAVLAWYNPFVWYLKKAVRQNLEFLADREVLEHGIDRKTYQYSLTRVSFQADSPLILGASFGFPPLKNRIIMMNKKKSSQLHFGKYVALLILFLFIGTGITTSIAQEKLEKLSDTIQENGWNSKKDADENFMGPILTDGKKPLLILEGKEVDYAVLNALNSNKIKSINVLKNKLATDKYGDKAKFGVIEVTLKKDNKPASASTEEAKPSIKMHSDKSPLYILDGEESKVSAIEEISPDRIKSISVLKQDPKQLEELYGEKAQNGVVLIELKKD